MGNKVGAPKKKETMSARFNGVTTQETYDKFMRLVKKIHDCNRNQALNEAINLYISKYD